MEASTGSLWKATRRDDLTGRLGARQGCRRSPGDRAACGMASGTWRRRWMEQLVLRCQDLAPGAGASWSRPRIGLHRSNRADLFCRIGLSGTPREPASQQARIQPPAPRVAGGLRRSQLRDEPRPEQGRRGGRTIAAVHEQPLEETWSLPVERSIDRLSEEIAGSRHALPRPFDRFHRRGSRGDGAGHGTRRSRSRSPREQPVTCSYFSRRVPPHRTRRAAVHLGFRSPIIIRLESRR